MAQPTVVVIEDETDILDLVAFNLEQAGFRVLKAQDGLEGLSLVRRKRPDLIILDLMLPHLEGQEVCRRIRRAEETKDIPIIMLTARTDEIDRIVGFEIGADDYITKPFSPRELILRVKAVLRRTQEKPRPAAVLNFDKLSIDPERHWVEVEGRAVYLTATEFRLLHHLAVNSGRVLSRDVLLDKVWGYDFEGYARTVDTHVRRLRQKLGPAKELIETIRGVGYCFRESR